MVRWLICLLPIGILIGQDDGLPPNFVYLDPIEDFYARSPIEIEIIVTDRNEIEEVAFYYRFDDANEFSKQEMRVSYQPVIYNVEIPLDEVESGVIQYYFWAKDKYDNGATFPSGGEDMPMVLPIYSIKKEKGKPKEEISMLVDGSQAPEELEDNLPYYLEIGMLAPSFEVTQEEGVPIVVISVYDSENIVILESTRLLIDGDEVSSFISPDMITYIPQDPFNPGYHIIRYETKNNAGEILFKEFSFFMHEKIIDESEKKETSWKDAIKFKGNLGWNTDYDPSPNRPIDTHKINSSVKFQLGEYKFNLSGLMNTHIYDADAREEATHRQPSSRVKIKINSPYIDFHYGDNSPEFSEFSLKGTRVRGSSTKLKWGTWETSLVSGETKHWVRNGFNQISSWDSLLQYHPGDQVYSNGVIWESITLNTGSFPDTSNSYWTDDLDSDYSIVSNDECEAVNPVLYGLEPFDSELGKAYTIWTGVECEEVILYSHINMITGKNGVEKGVIYLTVEDCLQQCKTPITYEKGFPIRQLQGFRTSKDFFKHAKFGVSAIRSWDVRDETLTPYSIFHDAYTYEGNIAAAGDFSFHFNHDKTVLSGEYGLSMTIDQTYSDTLLLRNISNFPDSLSLYSYTDWNGVDYCYQNKCVDINGDGIINEAPEFVEGAIQNDSIWAEYNSAKDKINDIEKTLGFVLNDDVNGYAEGRGVSGLTGPELGRFIEGGLDSLYLLLKRPAFKVTFKTPIPLYFTELNFQTEFNQAPLNYLSHGSSSIQTNVRNWKNKVAFKLLKNQVSFSFGYDNQIKSPWDPESEFDGEIKRSITDTRSGTIGLGFRNWPGINYSIRLQDRKDLSVHIDSTLLLQKPIVGQKKLITHTIAPTYKLSLGDIVANLNGNITFVNDLDELSDTSGCYEILNSNKGEKWEGEKTFKNESGELETCGTNYYYFKGNNDYPFNNSGAKTETYTGALSFSFPVPFSMNLGFGMSINSPNDFRQSKTEISVFSSKLGYKFFDKKLNVTIGGNYVIGYKGGNEFWDSGEDLTVDWNENEAFDLKSYDEYDDLDGDSMWSVGDTLIVDFNNNNEYDEYEADEFDDADELDNSKLTLKLGLQYKMPEPNITIGLNLDYAKAVDHFKTEQDDPVFKAKLAIKFGF